MAAKLPLLQQCEAVSWVLSFGDTLLWTHFLDTLFHIHMYKGTFFIFFFMRQFL